MNVPNAYCCFYNSDCWSMMTCLTACLPCMLSYVWPDDPDSLKWACWSIHDPAGHASYRQVVMLVNSSGCPLLCELATEGPFELLSVVPSVRQDPSAFRSVLSHLFSRMAAAAR
jgi:hypothetical protein